jgi:hypothetical protein
MGRPGVNAANQETARHFAQTYLKVIAAGFLYNRPQLHPRTYPMQCISIQIQPKYSREFDRDQFLQRVRAIRSPEVDAIEEKGKLYLSFNFFTEFPAQLWQELSACLYKDATYATIIAPVSVAICEGETDDECLLLHHFDSSEQLDTL